MSCVPVLAHAAVGVSALAACIWLLPTLARPGQLEAHSPLPTRLGYGSGEAPQLPWVAIADTQSVSLGCLTTGQEALTEVNGSKGASATCWWTAWAYS